MDVEDDLREITEKDIDKTAKETKYEKIIIAAVSIFLVLLVVPYFIFGDNIFYVIEGKLVSEKIKNDFSVSFDSGKVIFENGTYNKLKEFYFANQKNEFKVCLIGNKKKNNYFISDFYSPKTFGQSVSHVSAELCNDSAIVALHSHPYKRCIFSEQDIKSYEAGKQANPDAIIGLMCEADRFGFYRS